MPQIDKDGAPLALRLVRPHNQARHHVTGRCVEIVTGAVEVRRHRHNEIATVLRTIRLAKLDAGDFRHRVPFVGRFGRSGQQRILGHRLRRKSRIKARRAQKHQLGDVGLDRAVDDIRCDCKVIVEKLCRPRRIGQNAADSCSSDEDRIRTVLQKPRFNVPLTAQVERFARYRQNRASFALKAANQRRADHTAVTRDPNSLARKRKDDSSGFAHG